MSQSPTGTKAREKNRTRTCAKRMRWGVLTATLLIATTALAGCLDLDQIAPQATPEEESIDDLDAADTNETTAQGPTDKANHTDADNPSPPQIILYPTARLDADHTTGQEAFTVTFRLDGTDPYNEPLAWMFDTADGDGSFEGTGLPVTIEHTYGSAGVYDPILLVANNESFGMDLMTITVLEGPNDTQTGNGANCLHRMAIESGIYEPGTLPREVAGNASVDVDHMTDYRIGADEQDTLPPEHFQRVVIIDFFDADGAWLAMDHGAHQGSVPPGADYGIVCVADEPISDDRLQGLSAAQILIPQPLETWHYQDGFIDPVP